MGALNLCTLVLAGALATLVSARLDRGISSRQAAPVFPTHPGIAPFCSAWWDNDGFISCNDVITIFGVSIDDFVRWNPTITPQCSNWETNYSYCIKVSQEAPTTNKPTITGKPTTSSVRPATTTSPGNGIETPTPIQEGMVKNCNKFHFVKTTTTCQSLMDYFSLPWTDLLKWNPAIGSNCQSLWSGTYVCVGVVGGAATPTTTIAPGNGIATPMPIQEGMIKSCNKFHLVKTTTTCQSLMDYFSLSWADLLKWNPAIGSSCQSLWSGTYACVGVVGGASTPTTTVAGNGVATPTPIQQGMTKSCSKFHLVKSTTTCASILNYFSLTWDNFYKWNPAVGKDCLSLWTGTYACVGVIGGSTPPTTPVAGNGIATPTPIQQGMTTNCNKFHLVKTTTTCASILNYFSLTWDNFYKWNPAVGKDCLNLWANTYACVGVK